MADVSLIPKEQKKRSFSSARSTSGSSRPALPRAAKIGIGVLVVLLIGGGVLYMWRQSLDIEKEDLRAELTQIKGQRDAALEKRITTLNTLLGSFDDVLNNHRRWSQLLAVLEEEVVPGIIFTQFEGNYETAVAALRGLSPNYTRFAQQVRALEQIEGIERFNVTSVGLNNEGQVEFVGQIIFDRDIVKSSS